MECCGNEHEDSANALPCFLTPRLRALWDLLAALPQCPPAPWLHNTSEPFNGDAVCPGHGAGTTARNMQQPAMMLVDLSDT